MNTVAHSAISSIPEQPCGPALDEAELVAALRNGESYAYEELVRSHSARLHAVARRFFPSGHDSEDAVQDAFVAAFRAIGSFEETCRLSTWLHRIVVNACLMKRRSQSRKSAVSIEACLPEVAGERHYAGRVSAQDEPYAWAALEETRSQIRACIDQLPDAYREVLLLRDVDELDTNETARLLNTTPANVKTRLHRARQVLRTLLEPSFASHASRN